MSHKKNIGSNKIEQGWKQQMNGNIREDLVDDINKMKKEVGV
jgi:hypothetical protein